MNNCPFCFAPIEKLTDWYVYDKKHKLIICRDLHNRDFLYRILAVYYDVENHLSWQDVEPKKKAVLLETLWGVVHAHEKNDPKIICGGIDVEHFSVKNHGHAQAMLIRR